MATFGVEFTIGIPAFDDLEDRVDAFYTSLAENFTLVSVDVALDVDKGSLVPLLGVNCPDEFDAESFVVGVAADAVKKALLDSKLVEPEDDEGVRPSARVLEFA